MDSSRCSRPSCRDLVPAPLQKLRAAYVRRPPKHHENTEDNTRDNIAHHYDLSNDLFRLFLDDTLSYSSALYGTEQLDRGTFLEATPPEADSESLAEAPGSQDRAAARRDRRLRGHPRARDRHRLGRAGHPRRPPRRATSTR